MDLKEILLIRSKPWTQFINSHLPFEQVVEEEMGSLLVEAGNYALAGGVAKIIVKCESDTLDPKQIEVVEKLMKGISSEILCGLKKVEELDNYFRLMIYCDEKQVNHEE